MPERHGKVVCGMLHGGGKAHKTDIYRLAKGERVMSPAQLKYFGKTKKPSKSHQKKEHASASTNTYISSNARQATATSATTAKISKNHHHTAGHYICSLRLVFFGR